MRSVGLWVFVIATFSATTPIYSCEVGEVKISGDVVEIFCRSGLKPLWGGDPQERSVTLEYKKDVAGMEAYQVQQCGKYALLAKAYPTEYQFDIVPQFSPGAGAWYQYCRLQTKG